MWTRTAANSNRPGKMCSLVSVHTTTQTSFMNNTRTKNGIWQHFTFAGTFNYMVGIWWNETISIQSDNHNWNWLLGFVVIVVDIIGSRSNSGLKRKAGVCKCSREGAREMVSLQLRRWETVCPSINNICIYIGPNCECEMWRIPLVMGVDVFVCHCARMCTALPYLGQNVLFFSLFFSFHIIFYVYLY